MSDARRNSVSSADGTRIAYHSIGQGDGVIVLGGTLREAEDYFSLAAALAEEFEVHVVERRGRGESGPQGSDYSINEECDDLEAVLAHTGARRVFGHSYGGLVVLETAKRHRSPLGQIAVYEPGVSVDHSIPTAWIPRYRERLSAGDTRGAFAALVGGSGHAPRMLERMPLGYVKLVLRLVIRKPQWRRLEPLLESSLKEHEEVERLSNAVSSYSVIESPVLLLGGSKSPPGSTRTLQALSAVLPDSSLEILNGLAHTAPDEKAPATVAQSLSHFFKR